jgi:2-(1,2-epoxy-1,2-dihydrophenyl)acetyl-CoA isomerase
MTSEAVTLELKGDIAWLTLNRPEVGNAIDLDMARALLDAAIALDNEPNVRCVVLTGNGRLFCAGGDVALFQTAGETLPSLLGRLAGILHLAEARLARMAKPLLVLVNGAAAGAGLSLALLGDVVLAASNASFTSAYGAIGLSPDGGQSWLLPRLTGLRRAQEMILTGRRLSAEEAHTWGLVTRVVDPAALTGEGSALAERLAGLSTPAIGAARALLLESFGATLETHMEREARSIAALSLGLESREGVSAFLHKRRPDFRSKGPAKA